MNALNELIASQQHEQLTKVYPKLARVKSVMRKDRIIMDYIASKPRATLTEVSKHTGIPISTIHDRLKSLRKAFTLTARWELQEARKQKRPSPGGPSQFNAGQP